MKIGKMMAAPLVALCGLLLLTTPSWSQGKAGKEAQENLNKSKAYKDAKDAQKDPNAVFDGSKPQQPKEPVKVEKSTTTVTPSTSTAQGGNPAPKQYQSLKVKEPPSPQVQPAEKQPAQDKSQDKGKK